MTRIVLKPVLGCSRGNAIRFKLLGPLEVSASRGALRFYGPRQETVTAALLLDANRTIPLERLIDVIWDDDPPATARHQVQDLVTRLRRMLIAGGADPGVITTSRSGYALHVADEDLDLRAFERRVVAARDAAGHDADAATAAFRDALALWRGPALAGIASRVLRGAAARLDEHRLAAWEECLALELRLGRHQQVLAELSSLAEAHPFRERLSELLLSALYGAGRRREALDAYQAIRHRLADELGLDPGVRLQDLHARILRDERAEPAPTEPETTIRPAQLPAVVPDFTGRVPQLAELDAFLDRTGTLMVSVIAGAAGTGKTALAVAWAHRVAHRFPDGQLFADLHGFGAVPPARPIDALAGFLRALGVPGEKIPVDVGEAAALYRSLLAGRRVLVILDNAGTAEQVRPLLPGDPGCLVLVTSRYRMGGLVARDGARRLDLGLLGEDEALTLLRRVVGGHRVDGEPVTAARLARVCGYLPLALRIAAAQLGEDRSQPIAEHLAAIVAAGPLDALAVGDDPQAAVRAAFDSSYARLGDAERRLFRMAGLVPGPDFTVHAAAALLGHPVPDVRGPLGRLVAAHLVSQPAPGRYALHDLLREYAAERARHEETEANRAAAAGRLFEWYLRTADAAARKLYPHILRLDLPPAGACPPVPGFDSHAEALAWFDAERPDLLAAIEHAASAGPRKLAWLLADTMRGYFWNQRHDKDWLQAARTGLAAAEREQEQRAQAMLRFSLGSADQVRSRHSHAIDQYAKAAALAEQASWLDGQAAAVGNLGAAHQYRGDARAAARHYRQALALQRRTGRRAGQAITLANLGTVYWELGQFTQALTCLTESLALYRETGSRGGEAQALANLGNTEHALGQFDLAHRHLTQALALQREVGKRYGEAETLHDLAALYRDMGDLAQGFDTARQALALARHIGESRAEAGVLNVLGTIHHRRSQDAEAAEEHLRALQLSRSAGHRYQEAEALIGLAAVAGARSDHAEAARRAAEALGIARQAGYRALEDQAETLLGD